ncbi:MAG: NUDIX domain-containing protein [Candidatus Aenigmarchaeota archaeon]|nr:NUDIX domain-containing protein [Candidatus Aenigmarchaeota archaeon]
MKQYPEPVVGPLIFNEKNEIILIKSPKFNGKYIVPGGHIEIGETMEEALKREIKEETNLDIKDIEFFMIQEGTNMKDTGFNTEKHFIFIDFLCKANPGKVILETREAEDFTWIKPKDALKLNLNKSTKIFIEEYLKRKHNE